jgi:amino acid permease
MIVAFAFNQNLFPVFSGLKVKTNANCQKAVNYGVLSSMVIYLILSVSAVLLFGEQIQIANANILNNINKEYAVGLVNGNKHWEAYVLRVLFLIVLACHIPFIFFSGKEALLIIIDEIDRKSVSQTLERRVRDLNRLELAKGTDTSEEDLDKSLKDADVEGIQEDLDRIMSFNRGTTNFLNTRNTL